MDNEARWALHNLDVVGRPHVNLRVADTVQQFAIGSIYRFRGKTYVYVHAGAAPLVVGDVIQSAALGGSASAIQHDLTPSATAKDQDKVSVTTVTDAVTKNQFGGGEFAITDGDAANAMGDIYEILSHPAGAAGAIVFTLTEALVRAITTTSRISIIKNIYEDVIQAPVTTPSGIVVGVACSIIGIAGYGWLQTYGIANVLNKTALTAGTNVRRDVAAAGSAGIQGTLATEVIGNTGWVTDTTDSGFVFLTIRA